MSGRFPGAPDVHGLWQVLVEGRQTLRDSLDGIHDFDAESFGMTAREAGLVEPAQRLALQAAVHALEDAGIDPRRSAGDIAVYCGKDSLATGIARHLDLRGPAVGLDTGDSSSLVAVSLAVDALRARRCDAALAGGVWLHPTLRRGGLGLVVLKRLDEALRHGDAIRAVILGSGLAQDGAAVGGVEGRARVVRRALADAGVPPRSLDYVEAGFGDDPAGLEALQEVLGEGSDGRPFCALGCLEADVGQLGAAGGVGGLIKVVQCLEHELVPATTRRGEPPALDPERGPLFLTGEALPWPRGKGPRRAGVSAFGTGGTHAQLVLEEAPMREDSGPSRPVQLIVQSARSGAALDRATEQLAAWMAGRAEEMAPNELADVASTLQSGRSEHGHRRFALGGTARELARALHDGSADQVVTATVPATPPRVAFVFPGQGAQYINMGSGLYAVEPRFRAFVDECAELLRPHLDRDVREVLLAADVTTRDLRQTRLAQPAVFVVEHSLARLWQAWGVEPEVLVGHSVGQYVAACLAGVLSLPDALAVVARRGALMQELPPGTMLSTRLSETELEPLLTDGVSLAAVNAPGLCVASGPEQAVEELLATLKRREVTCRRLDTSHAFHSSMMDPMIGPFSDFMRGIELSPPRVPVLCTTSGRELTDEQARDPAYWADHVREPVRFAQVLTTLWEERDRVVLEVGPGRTMATLARQQLGHPATQVVVSSLLETPDARSECSALLHAVGRLWLRGVHIDWDAFRGDERRLKVSLPGYPFEATGPASPGAPRPRRERIVARLAASLRASSEAAPDVTRTSVSFLELGLDSLFLAHWARSLGEEFGVPISVRQLLDSEQSLDALASYLEQHAGPGEVGGGADADRLSRRLEELTRRLDTLGEGAQAVEAAGAENGSATPGRRGPDAARPPLPGARLGRAADGGRAWFVPDPARPGSYLQVEVEPESTT